MMIFGDGHPFGWMTFGGRSSVDWCCEMSDGFEDEEVQLPLPATSCAADTE